MVDLYINDTKAELAIDTTITIVDSIQDAKDLGRMRAAFTREFILPGSKTNNAIFNYWHNPGVTQGLDARYRQPAFINVNGATRYEGTIRLNGVDKRNGNVVGYRVVFIERITNIKDLVGDDKLKSLDFSSWDHAYTEANVRTYLMSSLDSGALRYPLIYHTTRYFWTTQFEDAGGNALDYTELKPAMRCYTILDQIATKYGFTWDTNSFWYGTIFDDVYLWCHRYAGAMTGGSGTQQITVPWSEWSFSSGTDLTPVTTTTITDDYEFQFTITPNDSSLYDVEIYDEVSGGNMGLFTGQSGTTAFTVGATSHSSKTWQPAVKVRTESGIASFTISLVITDQGTVGTPSGTYTSTTTTFNVISQVVVADQMPDMTVYDFITSLFKMFNLVAYYTDAGEIMVEPLDDFYANATTWDLSDYIFIDSERVDRVVPFSRVAYQYEPGETFLMEEWNSRYATNTTANGTNDRFGDVTYQDAYNTWDGESYEVNVGFELMMYESQYSTAGAQTTIGSGWAVDKDQEPTVGAPVIMCIVQTSNPTHSIRWAGGAAVSNTNYNRPTNAAGSTVLTFNAEIDYYNLNTPSANLFEDYHKTYIQQVFGRYTRRFTVRARLPQSFIQSYKLYDTIRIHGMDHRINSIKINLQTQIAELELINIYDYA